MENSSNQKINLVGDQSCHLDEIDHSWGELIRDDFHVAVYRAICPVSAGHLLFVPKYNTINLIVDAFEDAVLEGQKMVDSKSCDGFGISLECTQDMFWPYINLFPKVNNPNPVPQGENSGK